MTLGSRVDLALRETQDRAVGRMLGALEGYRDAWDGLSPDEREAVLWLVRWGAEVASAHAWGRMTGHAELEAEAARDARTVRSGLLRWARVAEQRRAGFGVAVLEAVGAGLSVVAAGAAELAGSALSAAVEGLVAGLVEGLVSGDE